jgi:L-cysteine desulfidase
MFGVKDILRMEVAPALGCTEPSAIALAAAAAASLLPQGDPDQIEVWLDPNLFKNGLAVSIPGAQGGSGLDLAAALGAFGGAPERRLEVLETVGPDDLERSRQFVAAGRVSVHLLPDRQGLYVKCRVSSGGRCAVATIEDLHDRIVSLTVDGEAVAGHALLSAASGGGGELARLEAWLKTLRLQDLMDLLDELDEDDLAFVEQGVQFNRRLAEYGLKHGPGLGVGLGLKRLVREGLLQGDMILEGRALTSAAADARMSGAKLPAMSSAGSGNHGLTAILPIWAVKEFVTLDDPRRALEAVALSHLVTAHIKAHTGRLSAICGCSVAAGAGATAGVTYLIGGNHQHIAGAIKLLVGDLAGMICDGAKASCSLKLATAAGAAIQAALFSLHGVIIQPTDGIVGASPEGTMKNVGTLSCEGMIETDRTILRIMLDKQFATP